ncbi:MAG: peptidylprolyl isomerase [Ignavibacterium sp.]|nr:peptidylprolyl isomerase [Ignavibacterium sp.]
MGNSNLILLKFLTLLVLFNNFLFPQYNVSHRDLIETTAKREFDKNIIEKYLSSSDSNDVIAALLSISHSEDSKLIKKITELDFNKYGKWISFALGQIGESVISKKFLWEKLFDNQCDCSEYVFYPLGKIGNENDLQRLTKLYLSRNTQSSIFNGIEDALLQFRIRNITLEQSKKVLVEMIVDNTTSIERKKKALFTLARLGSDSIINSYLIETLLSSNDNELLQLSLMNFRIQKFFPADQKLLFELNLKSDAVRIEFIKALPYSENQSIIINTINSFLSSENVNENLIVESLKTLQSKKWDEALLNNYKIKNLLREIIEKSSKRIITEEAFNAYKYLFGTDEYLNSVSSQLKLAPKSRLQLLFGNKKDNLKFDEVAKIYSDAKDLKEKLSAIEFILSESNIYSNDSEFINFIFKSLLSDNAAIISITADGIDSAFISNNSDKLRSIILTQSQRFKHDTDFIEAEISLVNLSKKISEDFYKEVLNRLADTKIYSLRKILLYGNVISKPVKKEFPNLDILLDKSFQYTKAIIGTSKGNIEIKFRADLAPVTVGNFIYLAEKKFYDGIIFHRVVPGFVIQAGDPTGTGWGGPGYEIISEFSPEEFYTGAVGIASAGKDTEGSQFFIMQGYYPHLNGRYTLFAEVISGIDVVMKITEDDKIISIQLIK